MIAMLTDERMQRPPDPVDVSQEIERRQSNTDKLRALFLAQPTQWIDWTELAKLAGGAAWRTRVSDLRRELKGEGLGVLENRQTRITRMERDAKGQPARLYLGTVISEYRYLPYTPLGRDAGEPLQQPELFTR